MKTSVLFPIAVVLLFHQVIISTSSRVPEEVESFEASLFSPSSSSSVSSSQPLESNIVLSTRATSPLYSLLTQRKMETSGLSGTESGISNSVMCSSDQLIEKMVQPDMLVTAIKLYIDSFGLEATKSLINPILGLPNAGADRNIDQVMGKENKGSDYRGRMNEVTSAELLDSNSDQSLSSQEAFGESFRGAIDIGVNLPHGQVMTGIPHHHSGQGNPIGGMISNPSLLSTRIGESLPTLPLAGSLDSHPTSNTGYRSLVASRVSPLFPGRERVLLIPGRRIRPFSSKVRISANGKVREVKITVAPFMNILSALRQAEQQIQWKYPELATRKVIEIGSLDDSSKENSSSPGCYSVTKVGPIEANEEHFWTIKLTLKSGEVKFEGSCLPSIDTDDVRVRPGSTIDLIYH